MYKQPSIPSSNIDASEDSLLDISTAPTTPDGSLTFSPVLQALKLHDALEEAASGWGEQRTSSSSLDATMRASGGGVKNICCVGAGYVGELSQDQQLIPC
jgi:UDPglucose 6-dehydrogenase